MITQLRDWKKYYRNLLRGDDAVLDPNSFQNNKPGAFESLMEDSWGKSFFCGINWRAYPCNGSKTLVSQEPLGNSVIASRIFSNEMIVRNRFRSSLEQMWSKLFNCCKTSITKKDVKSLTVNWSAQRTVASKHPPFGTDEYSQFSEFPKSFFLHRSWGHNYLWLSTSGFPANIWSQTIILSLLTALFF